MFTKKVGLLVVLVGFACAVGVQADPVTVYNNFGPGYDGWEIYGAGVWWMLAGVGSGFNPVQNAQWFVPSDSGPLSDIYIGVRRVIPPYRDMFVRLCVNNNFEPPTEEDVLEEWLVDTATLPMASGQAPPAHLVSALQPTLEAGQSYALWVGFENNGNACWAMNVFNQQEPRRQRIHEYYWQWQGLTYDRAGALRVDLVPEPQALVLLLAGILPVLRRR